MMKGIIYVPGLGHGLSNVSSLDNYAYRYANALDLSNEDHTKKYTIYHSKLEYGQNDILQSSYATIVEIDVDGKRSEICKIFELNYLDTLLNSFERSTIVVKSFFTISFLLSNSRKFFGTLFNFKKKNKRDIIQILYMGTMIFMFCVGIILLIPSLIPIFVSFFETVSEQFDLGVDISSLIESKSFIWLNRISQVIVSVTAILAVFWPNAQDIISNITNRLLGMSGYLNYGTEKFNIIGDLEKLIEKVCEDFDFNKIELHGYSLGSVIVLDTAFPFGNNPSKRVQNNISTIVTIGCPYDFITSFLPSYFENRRNSESNIRHWYNVYSKADVISSNFRTDYKKADAEFGILPQGIKPRNILFELLNTEDLKIGDYIFFIGLRAHSMYWGKNSDSISCLKDLVSLQEQYGE